LFFNQEGGAIMTELISIGEAYVKTLRLAYSPVACFFSEKRPEGAMGFKKKGGGCIMPLIFSAASGKTVAFDKETTGWPCSAFYLGYEDWIFPGIERFLSHGPVPGRECERFVKTADQAEAYLKSVCFETKSKGTAVFKPVEKLDTGETPEIVVFFANADQLSALVYLLYYNAPEEENRVIARFASACGAAVTLPLHYARKGEKKAVWGLHDISARSRLPKELMTLAVPLSLFVEMGRDIEESFLATDAWRKIAERIDQRA
jgi:uncharacterized protein (DUF169 family)